MNCTNCGNKVKSKDTVCSHCGAELVMQPKKKQKTNKLGNCAIIFAFFIPIVGLILGIFAIAMARGDSTLRTDGIKAIIMSCIVTAARILLIYVLIMVGVAAPFIGAGMGLF